VVPQGVTDLILRFESLLARLGAGGDPRPAAGALLSAWASSDRSYHGLSHLRDCLAQLDDFPEPVEYRDLTEAALWFHDAVYDPRANDNEERSAEQARGALASLGVPGGTADEVARLVLLTRHREPPSDAAGRLLCDIDLSILGRSAAEFDAYDRSIRAEYSWVPDPVYRSERRRLLNAFLGRNPLYQTEYFDRRFETAARDNLRRAVGRLEGRT
jgi:predicted metal-dependent HD superfamily phosphohydrolase